MCLIPSCSLKRNAIQYGLTFVQFCTHVFRILFWNMIFRIFRRIAFVFFLALWYALNSSFSARSKGYEISNRVLNWRSVRSLQCNVHVPTCTFIRYSRNVDTHCSFDVCYAEIPVNPISHYSKVWTLPGNFRTAANVFFVRKRWLHADRTEKTTTGTCTKCSRFETYLYRRKSRTKMYDS